MQAAPHATASAPTLFQHRSYVFYLCAKSLAALAVQMQSVAIGWHIYEITGSLFDLGLVGLVQFVPFVALILFAGQAADRYDRRRIVTWCIALQLLCSVLLLALTSSGTHAVWPIFAVLAMFGCARAFMMPAGQSIVIGLVPGEHFRKAIALNSSSFHVATVLGPVVGGLLYAVSPVAVYVTVVALLLSALLLMSRVRLVHVARKSATASRDLLGGLRFVFSQPVILGAISLDLFAVLFGGAVALLPAVARDVLHIGPEGLGMLRAAPAIGAGITSLLLTIRPISRHVGPWMFGGVGLFGLATIAFGVSTDPVLSFIALALTGTGDMISVYVRQILVQLETPDEIRGRVSAISSVFIGASNELGEFESGTTAGWFGLIPAVVIGGLATVAVSIGWCFLFPSLGRMDRFPHAAQNDELERIAPIEQEPARQAA